MERLRDYEREKLKERKIERLMNGRIDKNVFGK
jgi:hypothetical protein